MVDTDESKIKTEEETDENDINKAAQTMKWKVKNKHAQCKSIQ